MIVVEKLNESFCRIHGDMDEVQTISNLFTFFANNYKFMPKYKSGRWDGKIRLLDFRNGNLPLGCVPKLVRFLKESGYNFELKNFDPLEFQFDERMLRDYINSHTNDNINVHDYQLFAIIDAMNKNKGGYLCPTGSGKSLIFYTIIKLLREMFPDFKILMIVPNISLVEQMKSDFVDYPRDQKDKDIIDNEVHKLYTGQSKDFKSPILLSTWQSLQHFDKNFFKQFDAVLVDEFHGAEGSDKSVGMKVVSEIIQSCLNSKIRIGMSGSLSGIKSNEMTLESLFGEITRVKETSELIEDGTLAKVKIFNIIFNYKEEDTKDFKKIISGIKKEFKEKEQRIKNELYEAEKKFIRYHGKRLKNVVKISGSLEGNTLVLFKEVKYGKAIYEGLKKIYPDKEVYFIHGKIKPTERERIRKLTEEKEGIIIVATMQIFATGINIKRLRNVVLGQPFKSKIKLVQTIGRIIRKHHTKSVAFVIDIIDNLSKTCYSIKHAKERIKVYDLEKFPYTIKEIDVG